MDKASQLWDNLKKQWHQLAPDVAVELNPGATDAALIKLEQVLVQLPEEFKAFYKVHDGQANWEGLIDCQELLSLEGIYDQWKIWKDLLDGGSFVGPDGPYTSEPQDGAIKNDWWNPLWIPFTVDGAGNHLCIDLDPTPQGNYGQVIEMFHDDATRPLKAQSFTAFIEQYIQLLESGTYWYNEDYGGFLEKWDIDY